MSHKTAKELGIHMPPPSYWPLLVTFAIGFVPVGIVTRHYFSADMGSLLIWFGIFAIGFTLMGWCYEVIKDKGDVHTEGEVNQQQDDLTMVTKLMLISEAAVFAALFAHYFYTKDFMESGISVIFGLQAMRPEGILETSMPAMGTMLLMLSSYTCHVAHHALMHDNRGKAQSWLIATIVLGLVFLGIQGYEWGYLNGLEQAFTVETSMFATDFYMMTGFHGAHVAIGIVMLFLVYARLEMGNMNGRRHFSMIAASWYWHFVDVVWIVLFFSIYLI